MIQNVWKSVAVSLLIAACSVKTGISQPKNKGGSIPFQGAQSERLLMQNQSCEEKK